MLTAVAAAFLSAPLAAETPLRGPIILTISGNIANPSRGAVDDHDIPQSRYDVIMAHNLLHLLKDPEAAITAACRGLKPGGVFISSTACIGDMSWYFRILAPAGHFLRLFPFIKVFTQAQLKQSHIEAGFEIDQEWLPKKNAAVFIVAMKRD